MKKLFFLLLIVVTFQISVIAQTNPWQMKELPCGKKEYSADNCTIVVSKKTITITVSEPDVYNESITLERGGSKKIPIWTGQKTKDGRSRFIIVLLPKYAYDEKYAVLRSQMPEDLKKVFAER